MDSEFSFSFQNALDSLTHDLTQAALRNELEPIRCRDAEIERLISTLLRHSKNNPVLIGEAGVGKTAVVEGLAQRIAARQVPPSLLNVHLLALSHMNLISGTSFRGQYEKRLKALVDEASGNQQVILFIDELHNLVGAGTAIGAPMDAANYVYNNKMNANYAEAITWLDALIARRQAPGALALKANLLADTGKTAEAIATRSVIRRSSQTSPSHMKIGNSTATKRGSDISGCAATGYESGSISAVTT